MLHPFDLDPALPAVLPRGANEATLLR